MKKLYIEGDNNPDLRMAFSKLLEQELKNGMPKIVMGEGKSQTIQKFMTAPKKENEERFLLVDSDAPMEKKQMLKSLPGTMLLEVCLLLHGKAVLHR